MVISKCPSEGPLQIKELSGQYLSGSYSPGSEDKSSALQAEVHPSTVDKLLGVQLQRQAAAKVKGLQVVAGPR